MADDKRYNGWANYETWAVKLWIDNEPSSQEYWLDEAEFFINSEFEPMYKGQKAEEVHRWQLAEALESHHEEAMPELEGVYADLLNAALSEVDWREIAESLLEDVREIREAWRKADAMKPLKALKREVAPNEPRR